MIDTILDEVEDQDNYNQIARELMVLDTDVIADGINMFQECYDKLVEIGEGKLADKYIKPLI